MTSQVTGTLGVAGLTCRTAEGKVWRNCDISGGPQYSDVAL